MNYIVDHIDDIASTVVKMLHAEHMDSAADILQNAHVEIEQTGYDNWNGGTSIWTIYLRIDPTEFSRLGTSKDSFDEQIEKRMLSVLESYSSDWFSVRIAPRIEPKVEVRNASGEVSRGTRQNIFDGLRIDKVNWSGNLGEVEFLARLYDLELLPSFDSRFRDAASDIWQHRENNPDDWPDDWVFDDRRFDLQGGSSEKFLNFLCEMIHPVVRPDRNEVLKLANDFNDQLRLEGWNLAEREKIAGRPRYVAERLQIAGGRSVTRVKNVADALNAAWMQKEIERLENAIERDPALAIGTAKNLVESCCKSILSSRGIEVSKSATLPELTKKVASELRLIPEGIPDEAKGAETIRLILRNLSALTQYLSELRGLYGSGHGRDGKYRGLQPRHARLAVATAAAFIEFITETHHERGAEVSKES